MWWSSTVVHNNKSQHGFVANRERLKRYRTLALNQETHLLASACALKKRQRKTLQAWHFIGATRSRHRATAAPREILPHSAQFGVLVKPFAKG
jgi:hypothetical protein